MTRDNLFRKRKKNDKTCLFFFFLASLILYLFFALFWGFFFFVRTQHKPGVELLPWHRRVTNPEFWNCAPHGCYAIRL